MTTTSKRAALYARISETVTARNKVADQLAQLRRHAASCGYEVVAEFTDDGISALDADTLRPGFEALLLATVGGDFDIILATEEERLARNQIDKEELVDACKEHSVTWETMRDGAVDPSTETGEFFSTMRTAVARMESRRKASRQRAANAEKRREGRPTPGRRCYGYEPDNATPRVDEAAVVRRMFEHVASGGSLRSLSRALVADGVQPTTGTHRRKDGSTPPPPEWTIRRVRDTLLNPRYVGMLPHNGGLIPSEHIQPLIDRETGERVRSILLDPTRRTTPGPKPRHLLSGLCSCAVCDNGAPLHFQNGDYRCTRNLGHPAIKKALLEAPVRDALATAFLAGGPDLLKSDSGVDLGRLSIAIQRNDKAAGDIAGLIREGLLTVAQARDDLSSLKSESADLHRRLEAARAEKGAAASLYEIAHDLIVSEEVSMSGWAQMKAEVLQRFDTLDLDKQREIVRALLYIEVAAGRSADRVHIEHKIATHLNADAQFDDVA